MAAKVPITVTWGCTVHSKQYQLVSVLPISQSIVT